MLCLSPAVPLTHTQMGTDDARRLVQARLGGRELTDHTWTVLVRARFDGETPTLEDLRVPGELQKTVAAARELQSLTAGGAPSRRTASRGSGLEGWQRRAVLDSDVAANAARQRDDVQGVRRQIPGWPLTPHDAAAFVAVSRPPALPQRLIVCGSGLTGGSHVIVRHGEVARLAERLAAAYGWQVEQAAWFVVTDLVPLRWPISITYDRANPDRGFTICVATWVPVQAIARSLRRAKARVQAERGRPQPRQRVSERASALVHFMATRKDAASRRVLCRAWNAQAPSQWRYPNDDPRHFWRDYQRAVTRLGLLTVC
jgi:hypothetical protein